MITPGILLALLVCAGILSFSVKTYLHLEAARLAQLESFYNIFEDASKAVIELYSAEMPSELLVDLSFLSEVIANPKASAKVARMMMGKTIRHASITRSEIDDNIDRKFEKLSQEMVGLYILFSTAGIATACFRPRFWGLFVFIRVKDYLKGISNRGKLQEVGKINSEVRAYADVRPAFSAAA